MDNYVGCDSSCMYSEYSHTCLWKRTCMTSFVLPSRGSGVHIGN
ncbi:hypothetical protein T12_460 [Trichinella patagoniensis]|uniref:Uncharacterized protein n=1 Tax=Trichinella patagoniensis TaxID=990121 RepID=A0A0V0YZ37_9BILA|nr:hypothetical protein T12_460 [Trichinella patagoniensis]